MWKINIATDRNETMTIFVAGDAFNSIMPPMGDNEKILILQNYAVRMMNRLREKAPKATLPTEPIYLEKIEFTGLNATITQYVQLTKDIVTQQTATSTSLHPTKLALAKADGIEAWNMKWRAEDDAEVLAIKRTVAFAQQLPPIDLVDSAPILEPAKDKKQLDEIFKKILVGILMADENLRPEPLVAEEIAHEIVSFSKATLENVKKFHFGDEENVQLSELNERIIRECNYVLNHQTYLHLNLIVNRHITASYLYQATLEMIAVALHNAARDYYKSEWAIHRGNINELQTAREDFNRFFTDIACINEDFSLQPASWTYQRLLAKNLNQEQLQILLSNLLNASYKNKAFVHLAKRLNDLGYFGQISEQSLKDHKLKLIDKNACLSFDDYEKSCQDICIPASGVMKIREEINKGIKTIDDEAQAISDRLRPKSRTPSPWQRNKATIISLCIGAAVAIGVGIGIALAPITLPALAIAGIIAAAAVAILGISAIIGRIIDKCKPAKEKKVYVKAKETQRLLDDFDQRLATEQTVQPPRGRVVAFPAARTALAANSLLHDNNTMIPPVATTTAQTNTLKL